MKSNTVNEKMIFESYPLTEELHKHKRKKICLKFPVLNNCSHDFYLSLWKYLSNIPERFYSEKASEDIFAFLESLKGKDVAILEEILKESDRLSLAFKSLNEVNKLEFHDIDLPWFEPQRLMKFYEDHLHPAYLKLVEGVYADLIFPISGYQLIKQGGNLEGFYVFNRVEELKNTQYEYLTKPYNNIVRNGIAHGKVIYKQGDIKYEDRKGNSVTLLYREFINLFDNLLDICNGLSLGLRLFYFTNIDFIEKHHINIPRQIMIEELTEETNAPAWEINECLEGETVDNRSQLNIYVKNRVLDPLAYQYHAFRSAILAEKLVPGYDIYFIILDSAYFKFGLIAFNGLKLKILRTKSNYSLQDYAEALENRILLIEPKIKLPRLFYKIITLLSSFKIIVPLKLEESKGTPKLVVDPRYTEIHRSGHHSVGKGKVIIKIDSNEPIDDLIRTNCDYIVKETVMSARKRTKMTDVSKYLPLGYLLMHVYSEDFRIRKLKNSGLIPELLCTIEFKRLKRIRTIDIAGGKPEIIKGFRIVWNKNAKI
jgi:hypothetical protein